MAPLFLIAELNVQLEALKKVRGRYYRLVAPLSVIAELNAQLEALKKVNARDLM